MMARFGTGWEIRDSHFGCLGGALIFGIEVQINS